ncbi:hypothetical protein H4J58_13140 [Colwellia sp. MB3u-70]|uniref:hypothetical protein n=1 Tax=unclassified Colwellia TaxID=196834 RepID=UPI0015F5F7DE|nr:MULTISPECIES: hypothetical protein [unclassified Colwellia]MBA6292858.1 hypothetical protein [Colwellia sp. MB3u-8]MBA6308058.1 hypothetical protein [Colwellia sp. MB3u-70]
MFFNRYKKIIAEQSQAIRELKIRLSEEGVNQLFKAKTELMGKYTQLESELLTLKAQVRSSVEGVALLTNRNELLKKQLDSANNEIINLKKTSTQNNKNQESASLNISPASIEQRELEATKPPVSG